MLKRYRISGSVRGLLAVVICVCIMMSLIACTDKTQSDTESTVRSLPSRSFFEDLDKGASLEEIVEQIGECGYEGSGIIYHVWMLDDGSKAKLVFNSDGRIEFIYIVSDDTSERIYDRDNS